MKIWKCGDDNSLLFQIMLFLSKEINLRLCCDKKKKCKVKSQNKLYGRGVTKKAVGLIASEKMMVPHLSPANHKTGVSALFLIR